MAEIMDVYLHHGAYPKHLTHPESLEEDFRSKWSLIELEVFEKEKQGLLDFARALAMNVGNPFKADQIAKMLDISRRKVNKYTELLMLHKVIEAIGPWGEHPETETTRHVKIYFSDLGYMHALLGDIHGEGTLRAGAIENFIYLELERKLDETHKIAYYRKKS